jgi:arylsulfatase
MRERVIRARVWISILVLMSAPNGSAEHRPNFIFFITDDISAEDLGPYGSSAMKTPNLDRLAAEGLVFDQAYLTASSCSVSRTSIITSRYPHNTGSPELHLPLPKGQPVLPAILKQAGYYTVLSGKHHMGANVDHGFHHISKGGAPGGMGDWVQLLKDRPKDKPFFFWFASNDAHRDWSLSNHAPKYAPEEVDVPPILFDGPETRRDLTGYYHEVSRTDWMVGELMTELARQGIEDETYLVYCSDNGRPFPRAKTYLYDSGIRTPLIVARSGRVPVGRTSALVSAIDFGTTFLDLAGVEKDDRMQGVSFVPVLSDPEATVRDFVFAERNWHVYQVHERMVRRGEYVYIRAAWENVRALSLESDDTFPAGLELWTAYRSEGLKPEQMQVMEQPRELEQLFHLPSDPHQTRNLSGSVQHSEVQAALREALARWVSETGDTIPDRPTKDRPKDKGPRYAMPRGELPGEKAGATRIRSPGPVKEDKRP